MQVSHFTTVTTAMGRFYYNHRIEEYLHYFCSLLLVTKTSSHHKLLASVSIAWEPLKNLTFTNISTVSCTS